MGLGVQTYSANAYSPGSSTPAAKRRAGMTPKVKDSGGKVHHNHITKIGDKMVRHILYWVIYTHINACPNGHIKRYYDACVARMGKPKARTEASNKLLNLIYAILRRGTPFITR